MPPGRRQGLSYSDNPGHLLKTIDGRQREKLAQAVDEGADPISSSEGEDEKYSKPKGSGRQSDADSDVSEPERKSQPDMKRTAFGKKQENNPSNAGRRNLALSRAKRSSAGGLKEGSPSKRSKPSDDGASCSRIQSPGSSFPSSAEQLKTELGFVKSSKARTRVKYSGRGVSLSASQESEQKGKKKPASTSKIKVHDSASESGEKSERAVFKSIKEDDSPTKPVTKNRLKVKDEIPSSPVRQPKAKIIAIKEGSLSPTKKPAKILIKPSLDDNGDSSQSSQSKPTKSGTASKSSSYRGKIWERRGKILEAAEKRKRSPPRAKFKVPSEFGDSQESYVSTSNTNVVISDESDQDQVGGNSELADNASSDEEVPLAERVTECPWCGEVVLETLLNDFSKGKRLNVQMQTRFCQKHKKMTAMNIWHEKGYPTVHWNDLEDRFDKHRKSLLEVINGQRSYYRDILAERIETGQGRSLKKEGNLNPGYYGPRGCKLMCDYLVEEFGELLKEKAISDRVIAGRGSAAFIQSVLVLELGTRLIEEDMEVSTEEAREIMEDSKALGELIHEEV